MNSCDGSNNAILFWAAAALYSEGSKMVVTRIKGLVVGAEEARLGGVGRFWGVWFGV